MSSATRKLRAITQRSGIISVEAAAVIIIIALLVALLIIMLGVFIEKAQDKGYTTEARNYAIAAKAVVGERYASGESMPPRDFEAFDDGAQAGGAGADDGAVGGAGASGAGGAAGTAGAGGANSLDTRYVIFGDSSRPIANEMAELMDVSLPSAPNEPDYWVLYLVGPVRTDAVKCDGFIYVYHPQGADNGSTDSSAAGGAAGAEGETGEGAGANTPEGAAGEGGAASGNFILVTYHMTPYRVGTTGEGGTAGSDVRTDDALVVDTPATVTDNITYDPSAGFSVYRGPAFTSREKGD
jgi:hypothetical protein